MDSSTHTYYRHNRMQLRNAFINRFLLLILLNLMKVENQLIKCESDLSTNNLTTNHHLSNHQFNTIDRQIDNKKTSNEINKPLNNDNSFVHKLIINSTLSSSSSLLSSNSIYTTTTNITQQPNSTITPPIDYSIINHNITNLSSFTKLNNNNNVNNIILKSRNFSTSNSSTINETKHMSFNISGSNVIKLINLTDDLNKQTRVKKKFENGNNDNNNNLNNQTRKTTTTEEKVSIKPTNLLFRNQAIITLRTNVPSKDNNSTTIILKKVKLSKLNVAAFKSSNHQSSTIFNATTTNSSTLSKVIVSNPSIMSRSNDSENSSTNKTMITELLSTHQPPNTTIHLNTIDQSHHETIDKQLNESSKLQASKINESVSSSSSFSKIVGEEEQQQQKNKHLEKVLVYLIQVNQSNDQSLSAQSKRAPHYLEEKYRVQSISSTQSPDQKNEQRGSLDKPTPILDTQSLIEDLDSELNLRALDERLISEEELIHHHGSSSIEDNSNSYEYNSYHNLHHSNAHHSRNNQTTMTTDSEWFEQDSNCLTNCSCDSNGKWPEVNGKSRKTLNCSSKDLNDYPILTNELGRYVERISLANNNIKKFLLNPDSFHCEKLTELDLSNNRLQQLIANSFNNKHIQHPIVEFHPSHNHHHRFKEDNNSSISILISTTNSSLSPSSSTTTITATTTTNDETTTSSSLLTNNNSDTNRQHLFIHCHRLKILALNDNNLNTLTTGSFRGLKRLRKLYLDNSKIRYIEKNAFLGANELRLLSLRSNMISTVHSDMFQHMINLRVLDLTGNSLTYLAGGVFNSLVALQALHLGHNKIRQLSFQCFSGLDGLQLLTLNSNQLKNVPRFALQPLKKLKILNMSGNPINRIVEDDFSHSFLQLLLLNHMSELQHVARFSFWDLPYLTELQITNCNQFLHLDEQAIVGAPVLHRLRLNNNAISQLDDRLLENLARMTIAARRRLKVFLSGNPLQCDCFLKPVYLCAQDQIQCKIELPDRENITCRLRLMAENSTTKFNQDDQNSTMKADDDDDHHQIYRIEDLNNNQLPNECSPNFVKIITPMNVTIVRRLRSKFTLSCKAIGIPTPTVAWLTPNSEIYREKLLTRHGHDLVESDLLTLPHSFQNDDTGEQSTIEQTENQFQQQLTNQATAAFIPSPKTVPYTNSVLMSSSLPSTAHHGSSTIRISHLTPNDAGLYTCIAENRLGLIRSHVHLITQQLKIELEAENTSTNFITIRWQVNSIFNPPLNELLLLNNSTTTTTTAETLTAKLNSSIESLSPLSNITTRTNCTNANLSKAANDSIDLSKNNNNERNLSSIRESLLNKFSIDFDEAIINAKNEQNLNQLDYQLLYKSDSFGTEDDNKQTIAETLGSERIFESNKFFASYESIQINRQLKTFTVAGLRPGTRYKVCIAIKEPRMLNILDYSKYSGSSGENLFRKRSIRRFKRLKRNLISVESASYLAINCLHAETAHTAFYARNILKVEKLHLPALLSTAFGTVIKISLICSLSAIVIILFISAYSLTKQHYRRSAYETQHSNNNTSLSTPYSTPLHQQSNNNEHEMQQQSIGDQISQNIYSPLMLARKN